MTTAAAIQDIYGERRASVASNFTSKESKDEGEKLYRDATKKKLSFQGCRIFRLCSRDRTDVDRREAIRMYLKSSHHFMNSSQWDKAGEAYENCAKLQELGDDVETVDAATSYTNAALCYKQDEIVKQQAGSTPPRRTNRSVSLAMERSRLPSISEDKLEAVDTSLSRLAHMQMDFKQYDKAMVNFEKLGMSLYKDNKTALNADEFFFKASMCALVHFGDLQQVDKKLETFYKLRPNLKNTVQFDFLTKLMDVMRAKDKVKFEQLVNKHKDVKIWVQKILVEVSVQLDFGESVHRKLSTRSERLSLQGVLKLKDPFYAMYN